MGDDRRLIIAALVILIIWATVTRVKVSAGKIDKYTLSKNGVDAVTLEREGKIWYIDAKQIINIYATKNSGIEIVANAEAKNMGHCESTQTK